MYPIDHVKRPLRTHTAWPWQRPLSGGTAPPADGASFRGISFLKRCVQKPPVERCIGTLSGPWAVSSLFMAQGAPRV